MKSGHISDTPSAKGTESKAKPSRAKDTKSSAFYFPPRLMSLEAAAFYLSVSYWSVRDLVQSGKLKAVKVPRGVDDVEPLRRILLDRLEIDEFVGSLPRE